VILFYTMIKLVVFMGPTMLHDPYIHSYCLTYSLVCWAI